MFYIITEDRNSARQFWECVAETFLTQDKFELVELLKGSDGQYVAGNRTLVNQIHRLFPRLKAGDTLFVAFDNILDNSDVFDVAGFIENTAELCTAADVKFAFSTYYCFEEVYLSYDELVEMYGKGKNDGKMLAILKYVNQCIKSHIDYFEINNENIKYLIDKYQGAGKNREHFANVLLSEITTAIKPSGFKIIKREKALGRCWIKDCAVIQEELDNRAVNHICNTQCKYICKNQRAMDKFIDLKNKSYMKDDVVMFR